MGTSDTQDLSSGYLAYLKKAASGVPSNFRYHHRHVSEVHFYSSQHEGSNTKSVFCQSLSQPGSVFRAFAYEVRCGAQYSSSSVVYLGQTRQHCVYITPEKIGYVSCFCDGCGDTQVWVATAQIAHDSQGVASLGLEKLYPVLPSETSIYFCYDFHSFMVVLMFLVCYIILMLFAFRFLTLISFRVTYSLILLLCYFIFRRLVPWTV